MDQSHHLDFIGRPLSLGDQVVLIAPGYRQFAKGYVIGFTPKNVRIEYLNDWTFATGRTREILQSGSQLVKVST